MLIFGTRFCVVMKIEFSALKEKLEKLSWNPPHFAIKYGIIKAQKHPKESFNTKNRYEKLDFLAWFGTTCDRFLLVHKNPPFAMIGIRVVF